MKRTMLYIPAILLCLLTSCINSNKTDTGSAGSFSSDKTEEPASPIDSTMYVGTTHYRVETNIFDSSYLDTIIIFRFSNDSLYYSTKFMYYHKYDPELGPTPFDGVRRQLIEQFFKAVNSNFYTKDYKEPGHSSHTSLSFTQDSLFFSYESIEYDREGSEYRSFNGRRLK